MDKFYFKWEDYQSAIDELTSQIKGYEPDIVLGIARGGLFPAASLGYSLEVKNMHMMSLEFYTGEGTTLDVPMMLPPFITLSDLAGMKVLVVDDVADTGGTLEVVHNHFREVVQESKTAVLFEKADSTFKCSYVWKHLPAEQWIDFPWS